MDTRSSHDLSDEQILVLLLLHLRGTLQTIEPLSQSFNVRTVNLFWHHLHNKHLEELIDRVVCGTPSTLPTSNLQALHLALHRCGGLGGLLSQTNTFCMRRISPQQRAVLINACVRFLQEFNELNV